MPYARVLSHDQRHPSAASVVRKEVPASQTTPEVSWSRKVFANQRRKTFHALPLWRSNALKGAHMRPRPTSTYQTPNKAPEPTTTAVTPPAAQQSCQRYSWL